MGFVNTFDVIDDEQIIASILEKTITEYADNVVTKLRTGVFAGCNKLVRVVLPSVTYVSEYALQYCTSLKTADFGSLTGMNYSVFYNSTALERLFLRNEETLCTIANTSVFYKTPIANGTGYIYVPKALIEDYKSATNWSTFAEQFRALEDYTTDGTTTGDVYLVTYSLTGVTIDNTTDHVVGSGYRAKLTANTQMQVAIVMGGVDVTADVYNANTGEINIPFVNGDISIHAASGNILYMLAAPTKFNGISDFVDTGIKLFDTPKDFTIICVAEFDKLNNQHETIAHCCNEATPYPGITLDYNVGVRFCYTNQNTSATITLGDTSSLSAVAIRYKAGVLNGVRCKNKSGEITSLRYQTSASYTKIEQTLLLGAYQTASGVKGRYFDGTISDFVVYDNCLSDEHIDNILSII
jgi:hypothetical protein